MISWHYRQLGKYYLGAKMQKTLFVLILITFSHAYGGYLFSHPSDGRFKQQQNKNDPWCYTGADWKFKAPDKWQHMMGSFAGVETFSLFMDDRLAGGLVFGLGILKEVGDGYREGWSIRDIFMDAAGVSASLLNNGKYKIWCDWNDGAVLLKISFSIK